MKRRLVEAFEAGDDYHNGARTLGIKLRTQTARWIFVRYREGQLFEDQRSGRREESIKVTPSIAQLLVNMAEQTFDLTQKAMKQHLSKDAGVQISTSSIARALYGQSISMKTIQDCTKQRNSHRTKRLRDWYQQQDPGKILVYIEESCFNIFTRTTRGRAAIGQPAFRQLRF